MLSSLGGVALTLTGRKFFTQANGSKQGKAAPPQQTKLSFSTKASGANGKRATTEEDPVIEEEVKKDDEEAIDDVEEQEKKGQLDCAQLGGEWTDD